MLFIWIEPNGFADIFDFQKQKIGGGMSLPI